MDGMSEMMGLGIQFVFTWGHLHSEIGALWIVFFAAFLLFGFALVLDCVLCISLVSVRAFGIAAGLTAGSFLCRRAGDGSFFSVIIPLRHFFFCFLRIT